MKQRDVTLCEQEKQMKRLNLHEKDVTQLSGIHWYLFCQLKKVQHVGFCTC